MSSSRIFNPFPNNIRELLIKAFEKQPLLKMPPEHIEAGCGVYAIYYSGDLPAYAHLSESKSEPIYVGKAVPPGARKGSGSNKTSKSLANYVVKRLEEHMASISATSNLKLADFECRWFLVVPEFTNAAEAILIDYYDPLWNKAISGFGIHDPGKGRRNQKCSDWDSLHPGRNFAKGLPKGRKTSEILTAVENHRSKKTNPKSIK